MRTRICLNGVWDGVAAAQSAKAPATTAAWKPIPVPHLFLPDGRYLGADRKYPSYPEVDLSVAMTHKRWYRTTFTVPEWFRGKRVFLKFGAINFRAKGFINGAPMGEYTGPDLPWEVDITDAAKVGQVNELLVHVQSAAATPNAHEYQIGDWIRYHSGIWQDVFLESRGTVHVQNVMIVPSVRTWTLAARTFLHNADAKPRTVNLVHRAVRDGRVEFEMVSAPMTLQGGETRIVDNQGAWPQPVLWGIGGEYGDPTMYTLSTTVREKDKALDEHVDRFGFREFWIEGFDFLLNGKRIFIQGTNSACERDVRFSTHDNPEYIRRLYRIMREHRMVMYRQNGHLYPRLWNEIADDMGVLVMANTLLENHYDASWRSCPTAWETNVRRRYKRWVETRINHPSTVIWSIDNEVLTQCNDWTSPAAKAKMRKLKEIGAYFKSLWPRTQIVDYNGDVFAWQDDEEPLADFHYPESGGAQGVGLNLDAWQSWFRKPVIFGETAYYWKIGYPAWKGYQPDVVKAEAIMTERFLGRWVRLDIPGFLGWWNDGGGMEIRPGRAGPWDPTRHEKGKPVAIPWPARSGRGARATRMTSSKINWFDPRLPEYVPNIIDEAHKKVLRPMPKTPATFRPQLIVSLSLGGAKASDRTIYLQPPPDVPAYLDGVRADAEGRSWFIAPREGKYTVLVVRNGSMHTKAVTLKPTPNDARPGYHGLNRLSWEVR